MVFLKQIFRTENEKIEGGPREKFKYWRVGIKREGGGGRRQNHSVGGWEKGKGKKIIQRKGGGEGRKTISLAT